jgi:four helix bundle protein
MKTYEESEAYKLAVEAQRCVHRAVTDKRFRTHFDLVRQILGSSNSACANIAEGFARYRPKDHANFLRIAKASLTETIEHIKDAHSRGLVDAGTMAAIASFCRRSRGACTQWILYLEEKDE